MHNFQDVKITVRKGLFAFLFVFLGPTVNLLYSVKSESKLLHEGLQEIHNIVEKTFDFSEIHSVCTSFKEDLYSDDTKIIRLLLRW